jgi:hypothetical protein
MPRGAQDLERRGAARLVSAWLRLLGAALVECSIAPEKAQAHNAQSLHVWRLWM